MPKSEKRPYHHGDLASALLVAAREVVDTSGWEAVSLRGVAREVGVSANATYRHFGDKAALLHAVSKAGFGELAERMREVQARAKGRGKRGAIARFEATGRAYFGYALDHPEMFRLMFGPLGMSHSEPPAEHASPYAILGEALDGLVTAGVLPSASRPGAELLVWTSIHGLSALVLGGAVVCDQDRDDALDRVIAFVVGGLATLPG